MAFAKISLIACLLAAVNAQFTPLPATYVSHAPAAYISHGPAYVSHAPVYAAAAPAAYVAHAPAYVAPAVTHVATPVVAAHPSPLIRILSQSGESAPDGSYTFGYSSEDGSSRSESGSPNSYGAVSVSGSYSYASPEGPVDVSYTADEAGYQPSGPGVHPAIQKAVAEQVAQAKAEGPILPGPTAVAYRAPAVYHAPVAVVHAPAAVYHAPAVAYHAPAVVHATPVYHAPAVAYHAPVSVAPSYVSSTPYPFLSSTTVAAKK